MAYFLLIIAFIFKIPNFIWKLAENEKIKNLISALASTLIPHENSPQRIGAIVDQFLQELNHQNLYVLTYFACEILSFLTAIGSFYTFDIFLGDGHHFLSYGFTFFTDSDQLLTGPINLLVNLTISNESEMRKNDFSLGTRMLKS